MKLFFKLFLITVSFVALFSACTDKVTYAEQLASEKSLISDFISRNNITVVETLPKLDKWPDNLYYKSPTGLYFHLTDKGDKYIEEGKLNPDSLSVNDLIVFRYIKYTLGTKPDTATYLNTADSPYPTKFNYYDFTQKQSCKGWHEAVSYMKYHNAQAKIIVYSKLGFSTDQSAVIPYGYDVRILIRK